VNCQGIKKFLAKGGRRFGSGESRRSHF